MLMEGEMISPHVSMWSDLVKTFRGHSFTVHSFIHVAHIPPYLSILDLDCYSVGVARRLLKRLPDSSCAGVRVRNGQPHSPRTSRGGHSGIVDCRSEGWCRGCRL